MTVRKLTARQKEILIFISQFIEKHKFPPTRSELSAHFGFRSPNAAEAHLRALEKKSMIGIERGAARGIRLLPLATAELPPSANTLLPLVGRVAAGSPILAQENIEDEYRVDHRVKQLIRKGDLLTRRFQLFEELLSRLAFVSHGGS